MCDEILSETVRKYPVIYDKNKKLHKDKVVVENAWKKVVEEVGLESVDSAKRLFGNLKKRFQRRRRQAKGPSGTSAESVAEEKERFKELVYLSWLEPFIIQRKTTSNCPTFKERVRNIDEESSGNESNSSSIITSPTPNYDFDKETYEVDDGNEELSVADTQTSSKDMLFELPKRSAPLRSTTSKRKKISSTTGNPKWHQKSNSFEDAQVSFFKTAEQAIKNDERQENKAESKNAIYGQYIASEIDQLPERFQRIARHEINNILYNIQNQAELSAKQNMQYTPPQESQNLFGRAMSKFATPRQPQCQGNQNFQYYPPLVPAPQEQSALNTNMVDLSSPLRDLSRNVAPQTPTRNSICENSQYANANPTNLNQDIRSPEYNYAVLD